jgi:hypothetical protein
MTYYEQSVIDRDSRAPGSALAWGGGADGGALATAAAQQDRRAAERGARASLRAQIARLECECSEIVAGRFPHISAPLPSGTGVCGPSLLDLGELERSRDRLAARVQDLRTRASARSEHERLAHEQLRAMELDPGSYKFVKLPVKDLGQGGCGVWRVRPRLGLIGMLAGWWQLTLSSGCPLPTGSCSRHGPGPRK